MVTQAKPEYVDTQVAYRITEPVDKLAPRVMNTEASTGAAPVAQCAADFFNRIPRHFQVRMQEPEHVAPRDRGACIHLLCAASGCSKHSFRPALGDYSARIRASAVNHDDLEPPAKMPERSKKFSEQRGFVQDRNDDRDEGRDGIHDKMIFRTFQKQNSKMNSHVAAVLLPEISPASRARRQGL